MPGTRCKSATAPATVRRISFVVFVLKTPLKHLSLGREQTKDEFKSGYRVDLFFICAFGGKECKKHKTLIVKMCFCIQQTASCGLFFYAKNLEEKYARKFLE